MTSSSFQYTHYTYTEYDGATVEPNWWLLIVGRGILRLRLRSAEIRQNNGSKIVNFIT